MKGNITVNSGLDWGVFKRSTILLAVPARLQVSVFQLLVYFNGFSQLFHLSLRHLYQIRSP